MPQVETDTVMENPGGPLLVPVEHMEGKGLCESDSEPLIEPVGEEDPEGNPDSVITTEALALPVPVLEDLSLPEPTADEVGTTDVVTVAVVATEPDLTPVADGDPDELRVPGAVREATLDAVSIVLPDTDIVTVLAAEAVGASDCDTVAHAVEVATGVLVTLWELVAHVVTVATETVAAAVAELGAERETAAETVPFAVADANWEGTPLVVLHADIVILAVSEFRGPVGDREPVTDVEGDAVETVDGEEL